MLNDITNMRFGKWTVLSRSRNKDASGNRLWVCRCLCGAVTEQRSLILRSGKSASCKKCATTTHGHAGADTSAYSTTYMTWQSMLQRVNKPAYVKKNITICDRWCDFVLFLEDMGERPTDHTLDRIDNAKGYYKENCRWATKKQQANNRDTNKILELNGVSQSLQDWADVHGIHEATVQGRLRKQWSVEEALTTPAATRDVADMVVSHGVTFILGIDEVATGAAAGPMFVAGVLLPVGKKTGAKDSKRYSSTKLKIAAKTMSSYPHHVAVGTVQSIEETGHQTTLYRCYLETVVALLAKLPPQAICLVVIDGKNHIPGFHGLQVAVPKADNFVSAVSTASVLAKNMQLVWTELVHTQYPAYAFNEHHGYLTDQHRLLLQTLGPVDWHRRNIQIVRDNKRKTSEEVK